MFKEWTLVVSLLVSFEGARKTSGGCVSSSGFQLSNQASEEQELRLVIERLQAFADQVQAPSSI